MWHRRTLTPSITTCDPWSVMNYGQPVCEVHENRETHWIVEGVTSQLTPPCHIIQHHLQPISIDNKVEANFHRGAAPVTETPGPLGHSALKQNGYSFLRNVTISTHKHACACDTGHAHKPQILRSHTRMIWVKSTDSSHRSTEKDGPFPSHVSHTSSRWLATEKPTGNMTHGLMIIKKNKGNALWLGL